MRILCSSDFHLDWNTAGHVRFDDLRKLVARTVDAAIEEKVDLYAFTGDLADPESLRAFLAAREASAVVARLLNAGIMSRWLPGNHDVVDDGFGTSTLSAIAGYAPATCGQVRVYETPAIECINGTTIVALPFTPLAADYDPAKFVREAEVQAGSPVVVMSHLNVEGIGPGSETTDMPRGRNVFLPVAEIRTRWPSAVILQGHYHRRQVYNGIHVVGSLARITFGEEHNEPGFLIVEV